MTSKRVTLSIIVLFAFIFSSCAPAAIEGMGGAAEATEAAPEPPAAPVATIVVVEPPQQQPTPEASPNGAVIYDDGENILSVNPDTGETKVLVSRKEVQLLIAEDRSVDSYTYGKARPFPIDLSPDMSKAIITLCPNLDDRFRCLFEQYVYSLEDKTAVRLPTPPEAYAVYWTWSPDGSTLAGSAWGYDKAFYKLTLFYAIASDGDVLIPLKPIANEHWQIAWNPGSKAFHPLTFITNFESVYADDSESEAIPVSGLEWNDKVECLSFSPDGSKAAFVIRRDNPKDHDWVFTARSNFTEATQVTEYDIKSEYLCNIQWSPDQRFIYIGYEQDPRAEAGMEVDENALRPGKLVNLETSSLLEPRKDANICGWTPDNNLVLELRGIAGNEGGIEIVNPMTSEPVPMPVGLPSTVKHCPVTWLKEALTLDIPEGLAVKNACHPGGSFQDEEDESTLPELFDITEASASVDGETFTAVLTMKSANPDLTGYLTPDVTDFINGFDILIDVDNNALSGDQFGIEFALSVGVVPGAGGAAPTLEGVIGKFDPAANTLTKHDKFTPAFEPDAKTLTMSASIPGITADSRLIFMTRRVNDAKTGVLSDRVCD